MHKYLVTQNISLHYNNYELYIRNLHYLTFLKYLHVFLYNLKLFTSVNIIN